MGGSGGSAKQDLRIEEAGSRGYVGNQPPEPVRDFDHEVAVDEGWSWARLSISPPRDRAAVPMTGPNETGLAHQPGDTLARVPFPLLA